MNVFEMMIDDLVKENGGLDCSLAIKHSKENNEEDNFVTATEFSAVEISKLKRPISASQKSSSAHHNHINPVKGCTNETKIHLQETTFNQNDLEYNINNIKAPEFYEDGLKIDFENVEEQFD